MTRTNIGGKRFAAAALARLSNDEKLASSSKMEKAAEKGLGERRGGIGAAAAAAHVGGGGDDGGGRKLRKAEVVAEAGAINQLDNMLVGRKGTEAK